GFRPGRAVRRAADRAAAADRASHRARRDGRAVSMQAPARARCDRPVPARHRHLVAVPMNPTWLWRNLAQSWRHGLAPRDVGRQMLLRYASHLPSAVRRPDWVIGCRFPPPIGDLRLRLRDNLGADLFVYSEVFEQQNY